MIIFPNRKNFYLIIFFISLISIISALYIEYILQYEPCKLCVYQRLPYIAAIFISFIGFNYSNNDQILIVTIMIFALSSLLSGYHFGIENNIFEEFSGCTNNNIAIIDKSELLKSLKNNISSCKDVDFKLFGISLAGINLLFSLLILFYSLKTLVYEKN